MSEQFAAPLFTGDHHGPTPVVSFFSTQEYSGLIELFSSPYASSLCCLNISVFLRPIDSFIRSDDPRVSVRRGCHTIPTFIHSPHRLHCDHSGLFAFFFSSSPVHHGIQYISRKPHASHFLTRKSFGPLLPTRPTIFIHPGS